MGPIELDIVHHDFAAKLLSLHEALSEPLDTDAAACAIEVALLLREPMWRQAAWRDLDGDAALAAEAAVRLSLPEEAAALFVYRAGVMEALGRWAEVEPLARRALALGNAAATKAEAMLHLGTASHYFSRYSEAKAAFARGLAAAPTEAARQRILHKLSRTEKAIGRRRQALHIIEELIRTVPAADRWFHAELRLDRAAFFRRKDPNVALALAEEAKEIYTTLGFPRGQAYADLELARNLRRLGNPERALACLSQAKAVFDRSLYKPGASHVRFEQGRIALDRGDGREALRLLRESYEFARQGNYRSAMVRLTGYQCYACWRARAFPEMLQVLLRAASLLPTHAGSLVRARCAASLVVLRHDRKH
jgi:tetratricopeptide (TPR) repeat protein